MANGILGFEGPIPEYIRKAARNALDMRRIEQKKLPLAVEGSGIPEPVRKAAQAALEGEGRYGSSVAAPAPESAVSAAAKGASRFLGPVGGILSAVEGVGELDKAFGPARYAEVSAAVENKRAKDEYDPAAYGRSQGAVSRGIMAATDAVQSGAKQYAQEAAQGKRPVSLLSGKAPVEKAVDQAAPKGVPAPAKAAVAKQVESQRQVVEQGAKKQLESGDLSRVDAAWALVQNEIERTGNQLTPQQTQQRVAEETMAMKSMDNDQLSRYLSYALVAGGLIASAVDKSGAAGEAFSNSYNAQLDRNQQLAMFREKQRIASEAAAAEQSRFETQERRLNRGQDIQALNVESQIADRERDSILAERKLNAQVDNWNRAAAQADARLAAYQARTQAGGKSAGRPPELSTADATELVKLGVKARGAEIDKNALPSVADTLRRYRQQFPDLTTDELMELTLEDFEGVEGEEGLLFDTPPKFQLKGTKED